MDNDIEKKYYEIFYDYFSSILKDRNNYIISYNEIGKSRQIIYNLALDKLNQLYNDTRELINLKNKKNSNFRLNLLEKPKIIAANDDFNIKKESLMYYEYNRNIIAFNISYIRFIIINNLNSIIYKREEYDMIMDKFIKYIIYLILHGVCHEYKHFLQYYILFIKKKYNKMDTWRKGEVLYDRFPYNKNKYEDNANDFAFKNWQSDKLILEKLYNKYKKNIK